ncbi:MAG TPA: cation:proton antiporter [Humibacillus sp.]|nr:cation:proton antiporter [Humibacillus sp.]
MELAAKVVAIVLVVILVSRVIRPTGVPVPIALLVVGAVLSFIPAVPEVPLSSELVLYGLLPPLLYAAALSTSLLDVRAQRAAILSLSVGLVLFTALGVGVVAWLLLPIPFAVAFALGAIVAPPDAVAATSVARRIGLPRKVTTVLEGESLLNDATALVSLRTALAAAGLVAHGVGVGSGDDATSPAMTFTSVGVDLVVAAVGGVAIGVVAYLVIGTLRRHLTEVPADTALSFVAPYLAYVPAEQSGASGVLAVVTAGLLLAHRSPVLQTAPSRLSERVNWSSITFVLGNAVFLLIGLQIATLLDAVGRGGELSLGRTLLVGLAVLVTCLVLRPVWMVPYTLITTRRSRHRGVRMRGALVGAWAGMRGVVTLAAALTLPANTPLRPQLVVIALMVTVGTLLLQGTTLPLLARALDVRGPDPRQDALQEATVLGATTGAGLRLIEADPSADEGVVRAIRDQASARVNRCWERLGTLGPGDTETPSEAQARLRTTMIREERAELLRIRDAGAVDHAVLNSVLGQLDAEETALMWNATRGGAGRRSPLRPPDHIAGACDHLEAFEVPKPPTSTEGCQQCLALGMRWVHLRACAECGQVGCCNSSRGNHAEAHFHETGHPVMRSIEPGEAWRWCYVDALVG